MLLSWFATSAARRPRRSYQKCIVRLSAEERKVLAEGIRKLSDSSEKACRARILLQVNAKGLDRPVARAFYCLVLNVTWARLSLQYTLAELGLETLPDHPLVPADQTGTGSRTAPRWRLSVKPAHWTRAPTCASFTNPFCRPNGSPASFADAASSSEQRHP